MLFRTKSFISRGLSSSISPGVCFVPAHKPVNSDDIVKLKEFVQEVRDLTVITGAGVSTESGIPDYRSKGTGLYARSRRKPIQYQEFIKSSAVRQRYWARNFVAWPSFSSHEPNATHFAITKLQNSSRVDTVITMNVDGLHRKAGSNRLVELHGCAYEVMCLQCGNLGDRHKFQEMLSHLNPFLMDLYHDQSVVRPDGDIDLPQEYTDKFIVPSCGQCGGDLMPNIVFFGDNVPLKRAQLVEKCVDRTGGILVLGSSLSTYSAYRLCLRAIKFNKPIAIVNIGETRADDLALLKIEAKCSEVVPELCL